MANEADKVLTDFLNRLQKNAQVRKGLALALLLVLSGIAGYFIYEILPRNYAYTITGGDILSNRHYLAKSLQEEVADNGVALEIKPSSGSQEALAQVAAGKLDFAFIQGGLDLPYPNVVHVATVAPELLHFLVRPGIKDISDLRGKRVNLGSKKGGTRIIARQVLEFSGLQEGIDYVESNISTEELLSMRAERMPEAIVITSFAPSDVADYIIKQRGYRLLEIPFPSSLSLRLGWVADSKILAYMYNVQPAVPDHDIKTIGVNLHLVANKNVEPRAVFKVLESLFNPDLEVRLKIKLDENQILTSASYPLAEGTRIFMERKNPFFSNATLDKIKALFGVLLSVGSTLLVIFKWFKGEPIEPEKPPTDDQAFLGYIGQVTTLDHALNERASQGNLTANDVTDFGVTLSAIKKQALDRLSKARFDNAQLPNNLLLAIADTRARLDSARP
jgi:TRAP-type uncharacterized transport system substrate-binding protein